MGKFAGTMAVLTLAFLQACSGGSEQTLPSAPPATLQQTEDVPIYVIGPLDTLEVFVWGNPELSSGATVRPDGRVTLPIVEDMPAAGKTPAALAREIEEELGKFVVDPIVTVSVSGFVGPFAQQVRIVGEASEPQAIPYRANMTILDVMIAVQGLTEFAAGNRTQLVRTEGGEQIAYNVRLDDLLRDGDISANVSVFPGDVIIIPESWF
jgi:polysaccharide export outer membrane protein